ncbi:MAG: EamA family transporter [Thermomicrobiales bacterium]
MSAFALVLILASAVAHATWNLFAKRASGGATFVWLVDALAMVIYAPFTLVIVLRGGLAFGWVAFGFIAGSAALHLAYFLLLQQGYRLGDLSLVYPLARGTGPMLATIVAIALFGERPTPLALAGAVLIVGGVFVLTGGGGGWGGRHARKAVGFALLTGVVIASCTLWDKRAVSALAIPPLVLNWALGVVRCALLTPVVLRQPAKVRAEWRAHRREALVVAVLSPLAYILVLTALVFTPVSYVAPAREIGILIGVIFGARLLAEGYARRRLLAAGAMVLGIAALALG